MGNKPVLAIVLIVVIVASVAFMVFSARKKSSAAPALPPVEHDLYCLSCEKPFKATLADAEWVPMMTQGKSVGKKAKCPACSKEEGVAGLKCGNCGTVSAAGATGQGGKPAPCPKCKKPMMMGAPGMPMPPGLRK